MSTDLAEIVTTFSSPLPKWQRESFYLGVIARLENAVVGVGSLSRACREVQLDILRGQPARNDVAGRPAKWR